jgi:hypothetical protein
MPIPVRRGALVSIKLDPRRVFESAKNTGTVF